MVLPTAVDKLGEGGNHFQIKSEKSFAPSVTSGVTSGGPKFQFDFKMVNTS